MATKLLQMMQAQVDIINESIVPMQSIKTCYDIDKAEGYWLDMINVLVDGVIRPPNTYSDTELRERIKTKVTMNKGCGTTESVINAFRYYALLTDINSWQTVKDVRVSLSYSGNDIVITIPINTIQTRDKLREIQNFIPVGVGLYVVEYTPNNVFTLASGSLFETSATLGLSTDGINDGGKLATIINYAKGKGGLE